GLALLAACSTEHKSAEAFKRIPQVVSEADGSDKQGTKTTKGANEQQEGQSHERQLEEGLATQPGGTSTPANDNRKIIRTGRIELVVATYDQARVKIDALVDQVGGYVDSTQVNRRQDAISDATIVVRIPSTQFGSILPKLREIGEIVSE